MFLRKKGASWSDTLLRDELFHAGIRHSRTRLEEASASLHAEGEEVSPVQISALGRSADRLSLLG